MFIKQCCECSNTTFNVQTDLTSVYLVCAKCGKQDKDKYVKQHVAYRSTDYMLYAGDTK